MSADLLQLLFVNRNILHQYSFFLRRALVQRQQPFYQELLEDISLQLQIYKHQEKVISDLNEANTILTTRRIRIQRNFKDLKQRFESICKTKHQNSQVSAKISQLKHYKHLFDQQIQRERIPIKLKTRSIRQTEFLSDQLLCIQEVRKQVLKTQKELERLVLKFDEHDHIYQQQLQKLSIENLKLQKMIKESHQQSRKLWAQIIGTNK